VESAGASNVRQYDRASLVWVLRKYGSLRRPVFLIFWPLSQLPRTSRAEMVQAILLKPYASRLPLARLTREERTALAQEIMGTATIPAALERLLGDTTDGNPFLSRS
jgi:hypothetical protein